MRLDAAPGSALSRLRCPSVAHEILIRLRGVLLGDSSSAPAMRQRVATRRHLRIFSPLTDRGSSSYFAGSGANTWRHKSAPGLSVPSRVALDLDSSFKLRPGIVTVMDQPARGVCCANTALVAKHHENV